MNAPNQFRPFREDDPMNSKNFQFYKGWSWYDSNWLGKAFFSDGNIKSQYNPNVFDNIRMFSNTNFGNGNKPLYYKYYNVKVAVYTTDNETELWDKYGKLSLDFDELAVFFYKYIIKAEDPKDDKEMILTKIKLGESLLKQSRFRNVQEMMQFSMNNDFYEIRALELSTKSLVDFLSRKGALFSDELIKDHKNIELKEVYFLDEKEQILKLEEDKLLETKISKILYGEKVKIRVIGNQIQVHTPVKVKLIAESQNKDQKFEGIEKMEWTVKFDNNMADTPYFQIPMNWFDESIEEYNYQQHPDQPLESEPKAYKTTFKKDALAKFKIEVSYDTTQKLQNKEEHTLIPTSYRRNYEELLGLFKKDNKNGEKSNMNNYENYFIGLNKNLQTIVNEFVKYIESFTINTYKDKPYTESQERKLKMKQLNDRIVKDSALLWQKSTEAFRNFLSTKSYDDRPLYWGRLKMQSQLKRMPIFKEDIDFETSQVKKGTPLDELLIIFEEKSRNYTGIDFGFTTGKKILITGYDPFVLNPYKGDGNILQSNPSGCVAQYLAANGLKDTYGLEKAKVQTMIFPVRYADFDDFKNGKGVVETFIEPWISKVDIIFTVSQGSVFRFDVDRFPCKFRGGFMDNMFWGSEQSHYNSKNFKQISEGEEFYETTLPFEKIVPAHNDSKELFWTFLNQNFTAKNTNKEKIIFDDKKREGIELINKVYNENTKEKIDFTGVNQLQKYTSIEGSGGDYLSNEIFYRVAKLRTEQRRDLKTGHLHIPLIQSTDTYKEYYINEGYRNADKITADFNPLTEKMIEETKKLILKSIQ